jgi:hypothetical protein
MAGEVTRAWLGLVWQGAAGMTRRERTGSAGVVRRGVERRGWQARCGEVRSDRGTASDGRHGQEGRDRQAGIGRQGKAWPGQAWLARRDLARNVWRGTAGLARKAWRCTSSQARRGSAKRGMEGHGRQGKERSRIDRAWRCWPRLLAQGTARCDSAGVLRLPNGSRMGA